MLQPKIPDGWKDAIMPLKRLFRELVPNATRRAYNQPCLLIAFRVDCERLQFLVRAGDTHFSDNRIPTPHMSEVATMLVEIRRGSL